MTPTPPASTPAAAEPIEAEVEALAREMFDEERKDRVLPSVRDEQWAVVWGDPTHRYLVSRPARVALRHTARPDAAWADALRAEIVQLREVLTKVCEALKTDSRDKSIGRDTVEYHLDGQTMYHAINAARAALAAPERDSNG